MKNEHFYLSKFSFDIGLMIFPSFMKLNALEKYEKHHNNHKFDKTMSYFLNKTRQALKVAFKEAEK